MTPLMDIPRRRMAFYGGIVALLLVSMGLLAVKLVEVKMLPFDNKSEFQVVLDLPEGATLETSNAAAGAVAAYLRTVPEVTSTETYAGTSAPFNFNGLVRHYFMRRGANVADVQVNLLPKGERSRQSHDIAVAVRPGGGFDRAELRRQRQDRRDSPRPAGALDAGGRGVRRRRQHPARRGHEGQGGHGVHPRRGGRGLDRRGAAGQARLPRGPGPRGRGGGHRRAGGARPDDGALRRRRRPGQRADRARGRGHRAATRPGRPEQRRGAAGRAGRPRRAARRRWVGSSRWNPPPARRSGCGRTSARSST